MDPEINRDIVSLGMVRALKVEGGAVSFDLVLTTPACPMKKRIEEDARARALGVPGVDKVDINVTAEVQTDLRDQKAMPPGIKNVIAVASGKGGVGKSSVTANIAFCLARDGAKVGVLDADIYGPNLPQMLGIGAHKPETDSENKVIPASTHGLKLFSMGFLLTDADNPVIWRGPLLHGAIQQFVREIKWGELDYLIVDLPPGTGDVQLSLSQMVPIVGAVIVTTPQSVVLSDVRKAVGMFKKVGVPILGVVENMSEFLCPHCGKSSPVFGEGGAKGLTDRYDVPCLGRIPLDPLVCESGEEGKPFALTHPDHPVTAAFFEISRRTAGQVSLQTQRRKQAQSAMSSACKKGDPAPGGGPAPEDGPAPGDQE